MRILVTGAAGFVGRHVINELKAHGHEPVAGVVKGERLDQVETVVLDICDREQVTEAITRNSFDSILHLAAISHVGDAERSIGNLVDVNVTGTGNLLNAVSTAKHRPRFIYVSSSQVFATQGNSSSLDETSPTYPETPYGWSKLAAEQLCQLYRSTGQSVVIVRPFNQIGPGQLPSFVVAGLAHRIKYAPEMGVLKVGNLETFRDFTDVRDIARGYRLIIEAFNPSPIYVLGSGKSLKIRDILEYFLKISGKELTVEVEPSLLRNSDPPRFLANSALAAKDINWRPERDLYSTLAEVYRIA